MSHLFPEGHIRFVDQDIVPEVMGTPGRCSSHKVEWPDCALKNTLFVLQLPLCRIFSRISSSDMSVVHQSVATGSRTTSVFITEKEMHQFPTEKYLPGPRPFEGVFRR